VHLAALSQRFAALKQVTLTAVAPQPPGQPFPVTVNLVHLQMALFAAIECWLALAAPGSEISMHLSRKENSCTILLACRGEFAAAGDPTGALAAAEKWPLLQNLAAALGGAVEIDAREPGIVLTVPDKPPVNAQVAT